MGLNIIYYSLFLNDYIDDKSKVQYTIIIKPQLKARTEIAAGIQQHHFSSNSSHSKSHKPVGEHNK